MKIYLASKSPRRRSLLSQIDVEYTCVEGEIDETPLENEKPLDYVTRMAKEKACCGWEDPCRQKHIPLLAADTSVIFDDEILGKPENKEQAFAMLKKLSGNTHQVITAVAVKKDMKEKLVVSTTHVTFDSLSDDIINRYISSGDCFDKAGAYGIQNYAARFVKSISGSYTGVVGLPLCETANLLESFE